MSEKRKPRYRATRTTPDPYPPHPVLIFTDKTLEEARRSSCLSIEDFDGFMENAHSNELSDWIVLSVPRFTAKLNAGVIDGGEVVMVLGHHTLEELEAMDPTVCIEIGHVSGDGPGQLCPRGQITEVTPFDLESALAAYADEKDGAAPGRVPDAEPETAQPAEVGVEAVIAVGEEVLPLALAPEEVQ